MNVTYKFVRDVSLCLLVILGWVVLVTTVMGSLGWWPVHHFGSSTLPRDFAWHLFFVCFLAPVYEEALFRYGWLELTKIMNKNRLPSVLISSIIFGLMHKSDSIGHGLLIQGVMGVVFCWMYLRHGYKGSVTVHALWNLLCIIL